MKALDDRKGHTSDFSTNPELLIKNRDHQKTLYTTLGQKDVSAQRNIVIYVLLKFQY